MNKKRMFLVTIILLFTVILFSISTALSAGNFVPVTYLSEQTYPISASDIAPAECDSIRYLLEDIIVCSGGFCISNGNGNELILGTSGMDLINGGGGDDCILGGGGMDFLDGENGNDVLVGGPDPDILIGNGKKKDTDICVDDPDTTIFFDCEVIP